MENGKDGMERRGELEHGGREREDSRGARRGSVREDMEEQQGREGKEGEMQKTETEGKGEEKRRESER